MASCLLGLAIALPSAKAAQRAYVANIFAGSIAVVDLETAAILEVIEVGGAPNDVAVAASGQEVFVTDFAGDALLVIDTADDRLVRRVAVGDGPVGVAVGADGDVYVANKNDGTVSIVRPAESAVSDSIEIGVDLGPNDIALTPDGALAVVTNSTGASVSIIDTSLRRVVRTLRVTGSPNRVAIGAAGGRAFVSRFAHGGIQVIDLRTLERETELEQVRATSVTATPDGATVFALRNNEIVQIDARSLEVSGVVAGAPRDALGLAFVPGRNALAIPSFAGDRLVVLPAPAGTDAIAPPETIHIVGGPFAVDILPDVDEEPLAVSIRAPDFGERVEPNATFEVRVTVEERSGALQGWRLFLRPESGALEREIAAGSRPLIDTAVAIVDARELAPGASPSIELVATTTDGDVVERHIRILVPKRRYAVAPLYESRFDRGRTAVLMDATGDRFVRALDMQLQTYDVPSGRWRDIDIGPAASPIRLSRDGQRLLVSMLGPPIVGFRGLGMVRLEDLQITPIGGRVNSTDTDLDADGRWLAAMWRGGPRGRYRLFDTVGGVDIALSDTEHIHDPALPVCDEFSSNRPLLSADGDLVAFVTSVDFGFEDAGACNLFTYRRSSDELRLLAVLPQLGFEQPSMDDGGDWMAFVVERGQVLMIDLRDGTVARPLEHLGIEVRDAVLSGDAASLILSGCFDLDAEVGNPDLNQEVFRYDLTDGRMAQLTDTTGRRCVSRSETARFQPLVGRDPEVVAFTFPGDADHGPRDLRTGLALGSVRIVEIDESNLPPRVEIDAPDAMLVGSAYEVQIAATDADGDPVVFFADIEGVGSLPPEASLEWLGRDVAVLGWTPPAPAAGLRRLVVGAFDGRGGFDVATVELAVCVEFSSAEINEIIRATFDPLAGRCGGDINGDGRVGAADIATAQLYFR